MIRVQLYPVNICPQSWIWRVPFLAEILTMFAYFCDLSVNWVCFGPRLTRGIDLPIIWVNSQESIVHHYWSSIPFWLVMLAQSHKIPGWLLQICSFTLPQYPRNYPHPTSEVTIVAKPPEGLYHVVSRLLIPWTSENLTSLKPIKISLSPYYICI